MLKKIVVGLLVLLLLTAVGAGGFVMAYASDYDESAGKKYDLPLQTGVTVPNDEQTIARGKHLAGGIGGCTACHGDDLGGGKAENMGPMGVLVHPNVTSGGKLAEYSDAELLRLLRHGVKRDGTTVRMMPIFEISWWPDADRLAVIAYLRSLPPVQGQPGKLEVTAFGKVLDRFGSVPFDVARRVDHTAPPAKVEPAPTAEYGQLISIGCRGCHGEKHLAGGKIPGAPPEIPIPLNLTPHETGLKGWKYDDFVELVQTGKRKNGKPLDPFMPVGALRNYSEVELKATWAYLSSLPPVEFGAR